MTDATAGRSTRRAVRMLALAALVVALAVGIGSEAIVACSLTYVVVRAVLLEWRKSD